MIDCNETFGDAFNLFCGELLGQGIHRHVFSCPLRSDLVVKVEQVEDGVQRSFSNFLEWKFWQDNEHYKKVSDWLAPCVQLSPDGRVLIQKRVKIATADDNLPTELPGFLTDLKPPNFGWLNGKFVCVDYSMHLDNPNIRLRKVKDWRLDE